MPVFTNTEKMQEVLGGLFEKLLNDPDRKDSEINK